jgi:hypothetical protein
MHKKIKSANEILVGITMPSLGNLGINEKIIHTEKVFKQTQCEGIECANCLTTGYNGDTHKTVINIQAKKLSTAEPHS